MDPSEEGKNGFQKPFLKTLQLVSFLTWICVVANVNTRET